MIIRTSTATGSCRKRLLITRLIVILFLTGIQASAHSYSQTVTLSVQSMPLEKVCKEIEKQTGYFFVYAKDLSEKKYLISLQVKNVQINEALQKLFSGLPYTYSLIDKVIVINTVKRTAPAAPAATTAAPLVDTISVEGKVVNRQGEPMVNASVMSSKTKRSAITDSRGNFKIKGLAAGEVLMVSYAGFKTHMVSPGKQPLFVVLEVAESELDKVVVQAYGTTSRRLTTSNIGVVTSKELQEQRTMNPLLALQGKVPGLEITPTSGYASGPVKVEIRGRSVVNPNFTSDPLYIIDGVPLTILDIGGTLRQGNTSVSRGAMQSGVSITGGQSPLFNLNMADIESMEVLKDADATAIYGSRGANGVILITTKKGKPGKNRINIDYSQGVNFVTRTWDMLNTSQYLAMRREAFKNDGITPTVAPGPGYAPDLLLSDTTRNIDWQHYLWGHLAQWTNIQTDYSGGTALSTFRIGAGYNRSKDITTTSGADQKTSFSLNFMTHSLDNKFNFSLGANYASSMSNMNNLSGVAGEPPIAPPVYDSSGNLNFLAWKNLNLSYPFGGLLQPYVSKSNFLTTNIELKYYILPGLVARSTIGYNMSDDLASNYQPLASQDTTGSSTSHKTGAALLGIDKANNLIVEPQVEYNLTSSVGRWNVLAGGTYQNNTTTSYKLQGGGYTDDALLYSMSNAPVQKIADLTGKYKYAGVFVRINYNLDNKYILNLNARRDGSSRFGPGKQFGNFGSVGAAWLLSEEGWATKILPGWVSFLKFRGSYGITGSDAVGDYQYLTQWGNTGALTNYNGVAPLAPQIQANNNFHWQSNRKTEAGMDVGFIADRINLQVVYYSNRCDNQLVAFPTPTFTGFSSVTANSPANVRNSGWESSLNANLISKKNFSWSVSFNIGINTNKLLSYPDLDKSPYFSMYKIGQPLTNLYLFKYLGVDPLTGSYVLEDHNHDGKISAGGNVSPGTVDDDRYIAVNMAPKYFGGFTQQFRYKNWYLSANFSYKKGIGNNFLKSSYAQLSNISQWEYDNRWQKPGDIALAPKLTNAAVFSDFSTSDGNYTDASFIRLRTVALSYGLPAALARKAHLSNLSFNINAQNLFVITKFKGGDPEAGSFGSLPPTRTITAGISCSL